MRLTKVMRKIALLGLVWAGAALVLSIPALAQEKARDPLASWNEGPAKQAIISFVKQVTDKSGSAYVPPKERLATFDQDGTLWVEHPLYA